MGADAADGNNRLTIKPRAFDRSLMAPGTSIVVRWAFPLAGAVAVVQRVVNRRWWDVAAIAGFVILFAAVRAVYRYLYFRNSSLVLDGDSVAYTNAFRFTRRADRKSLDHIVVTRGSMPTVTSPAIGPKMLMWSKSGRLALRASAKYFAPKDLRRFCSVLGLPADGPDGVWVREAAPATAP